MVTQKAEFMGVKAPVPAAESMNKGKGTITESFQSYIAGNGSTLQNGSSYSSKEMLKRSSEMNQKSNQKDAFDKISTGSYRKQTDQMKKQPVQKESSSAASGKQHMKKSARDVEADIRNVVKDTMDMTDEEIDEVLAEMSISIFDLLQPNVLQDFLMTATETEPIDMLTNGELADMLQTMNLQLADLTDGMDDAELKQMIAELGQELSEEMAGDAEALTDNMDDKSVAQEKAISDAEARKNQASEAKKELLTQDDGSEGEITGQDSESGIQVTVKGTSAERDTRGDSNPSDQMNQNFAGEIVNQLSQAVSETESTVSSYSSSLERQDIVRQVVDQIKIFNSNENTRMQIQLYPEHLGRIEIQVLLKNGTMTAQITAETEMAKAAIESQLQALKEAFDEKSMRVEAIEVMVGTPDFRNDQEGQNSTQEEEQSRAALRRRRVQNSIYGESDTELDEEEQEEKEQLEIKGASVEFQA